MVKTAKKKRSAALKTTLMINEGIMRRTKQLAAKNKCTISTLVESGLRLILDQDKKPQNTEYKPLPTRDCGPFLVDISDRDALYEAMEGGHVFR